MTDPDASERILVAAPLGRDGRLMVEVLAEAGHDARACQSAAELADEIDRGAGMAVITYEFLDAAALELLAAALRRQPRWSDLPLLFFTPGETDPLAELAAERLQSLGNVGLLERPIRMATLLSSVAASLRSRRHQYEMRRLLQELQDAVLHRDQFLAMLGHELRNPLGAIVTAVEVMEAQLGGEKAEDAAAPQRAVIRRQAGVLSRLVDDLLDVARVTSGKIRLKLEPVDLASLVRRAVEAQAAVAERRQVALRCSVESPGATVGLGDGTRLEQVLHNLLNNALKYTPAGGAVDVKLSAHPGAAVIEVRDTGIGMEPDVLPRVFDLFRQADQALHRSGGGLGLGLTLSRSLVELHGGTISAASAGVGRGSTFSVILPLKPATAPAAPEPVAPVRPARLPALSVVVVEDHEDNREGMVALLRSLGCSVQPAVDGREGLARIEQARPDAAIVDVGLPGIDGYELARRVRQSLGRDILLVALTGYGRDEDRERALAAGFDLHLTKPVSAEVLRTVLDRARAARPAAAAIPRG